MINPERQRVLDYLDTFGIDGRTVAADTIDEEGFCFVGYDTKHPWPEGFWFDWLQALRIVADRADFRRAGIRLEKDVVE